VNAVMNLIFKIVRHYRATAQLLASRVALSSRFSLLAISLLMLRFYLYLVLPIYLFLSALPSTMSYAFFSFPNFCYTSSPCYSICFTTKVTFGYMYYSRIFSLRNMLLLLLSYISVSSTSRAQTASVCLP
jgi:hypothetical protein